MYVSVCLFCFIAGGGKRATRMTIAIAVSIWLLAILCAMPALIGTNVKVSAMFRSSGYTLKYIYTRINMFVISKCSA